MASWNLKDLESWDRRIRERVEAFGLKCFLQEFEVCDHSQMLDAMSYSGMPSHYPHWSYGKAYEKLKTLYDHGVSGLPYEMVINANPSLAYLMRDNSLCLQILTVAHVYGHNDFFRNNFTFQTTAPEHVLGMFKAHASRIRAYVEDPSIGLERVESILDAAHALSLQCRRNLAVRKLSVEEDRQRLLDSTRPKRDPYPRLHRRDTGGEPPDLQKIPPSPEADLLPFLAEFNPFLEDWERDLLTVVHEETRYFVPQIETKIMNEGWASFWHYVILNSIALPQDLQMEFMVRHNQVIRPIPGGLNPYHLGFRLWMDIYRRFGGSDLEHGETPTGEGLEKLFEVRASDRDVSFLRRFLTEPLMRELDLIRYEPKGEQFVVSEVADEESWKRIRETLLQNVGMGTVPVILVEDAGFGRDQRLQLRHVHDGRDLHLESAEKTLAHTHRLWGRDVVLETILDDKPVRLVYTDEGFSREPL